MRPAWTFFFLLMAASASPAAGWPQWGGPTRDFQIHDAHLATSWSAEGPKRLWKRDLGFGHSSIIVDESGRRLFTMYRHGDEEAVISLDASTGETLWEFRYPAPFLETMNMDVGPGPHATPLLVGNRLYTAGVTGRFHCLDASTGKVLWKHGLIEELGGTIMVRGYSSSPIRYGNTVIAMMGGPGHALIAFDQRTGKTVWSALDYKNSHSSPILITFEGQDQLVALMDKIIIGVDPSNGKLLWQYPNDTIGDHTAVSPLWDHHNLIFVSSAYNGGSRVVELSRVDGRTEAKEVWAHKQMRVHHSDVLLIGDYLYGTSGDFGPAFLQAVNLRTGEILYKARTFPRANALHLGGGRVLVLDEDGVLALGTYSPEGIEITSKTEVLENKAWTPPTLVGKRLYLRDRKVIMAMELP